jgi:hypothetical protein
LSSAATIRAVTLFEDLGWKGLRARDAGPEDPAFDCRPGEVFPVAEVVRAVAGRVAVMAGGRIVESGPADAVFANPVTPECRELIEAVPDLPQGVPSGTPT